LTEDSSIEEAYKYGACLRCLTPKPAPDLPDLCVNCEREIERIVGSASMKNTDSEELEISLPLRGRVTVKPRLIGSGLTPDTSYPTKAGTLGINSGCAPLLTATGRKRSEPALQNIPIRTKLGSRIRKAWLSDPFHCPHCGRRLMPSGRCINRECPGKK
jgi:hypothetical protein